MVTRVRIEAEGRSPQEVEHTLTTAHERLVVDGDRTALNIMFGEADGRGAHPALADAQMGEFVVERFARDGEPGVRGQVFYRGRMTAHYARPSKALKLSERTDDSPYVANLAGDLTEERLLDEIRSVGPRRACLRVAPGEAEQQAKRIIGPGAKATLEPWGILEIDPEMAPGTWEVVAR